MKISGDFRDTREWHLGVGAFVLGVLTFGLVFGSDLPGTWRTLIGVSGVVLVGLMIVLAFRSNNSRHRGESGRAGPDRP